MFGFLKQVGDYTRDAVDAARNLTQGLAVTFDHMKRRPGRCSTPTKSSSHPSVTGGGFTTSSISASPASVCAVCPINLPVVDWVMNKATKKKELRNYSIDFGVCIFCGNCVEYCPTNCLSMTRGIRIGGPLTVTASITTMSPSAVFPPASPLIASVPFGNSLTCRQVRWTPMVWIQLDPVPARGLIRCWLR